MLELNRPWKEKAASSLRRVMWSRSLRSCFVPLASVHRCSCYAAGPAVSLSWGHPPPPPPGRLQERWTPRQTVRSGLVSVLLVCSQTLMSWDSDILASVFLTRRAVRREAGLWAQHSVMSFPICLKHWQTTKITSNKHNPLSTKSRWRKSWWLKTNCKC